MLVLESPFQGSVIASLTFFDSKELTVNAYIHMSPSDRTAVVDEFANGLTNVLPSTIAFGLCWSTSCEGIGIFVVREDEFVSIGAVSAIVIDAVDD
nr:hypothetical protein [Tanacetum cinerariifolium]